MLSPHLVQIKSISFKFSLSHPLHLILLCLSLVPHRTMPWKLITLTLDIAAVEVIRLLRRRRNPPQSYLYIIATRSEFVRWRTSWTMHPSLLARLYHRCHRYGQDCARTASAHSQCAAFALPVYMCGAPHACNACMWAPHGHHVCIVCT